MDYAMMISKLRESGMKQAEIARRIGRSQSVVSEIERGRSTEIRASTGSAIASLYASTFGPAPARRKAA